MNGGRDAAANFQSHLLHVRELVSVLRGAGLPPDAITIFTGDGDDVGADVALREPQPEHDFWLIQETRLGRALRTPITRASSSVEGFALHPATRREIASWFAAARDRLRPGDTLLLYVTDHGTKGETPEQNKIVLWGTDENLSVRDLRTHLSTLDPGVRVVLLMSQCYSGAFARLGAPPDASATWQTNVCGYVSSTADRPAYGCYPENRGRENVGHSFEFLRALTVTPNLAEAHARVLVTDATPDVPHRTSDAFLEDVLRRAAERDGSADWTAFADGLLRSAWEDRAEWEPEIRLLDAIAHAYGVFSPRSLAEIDAQGRQLPEISTEYRGFARAWRGGLADATSANLTRFVEAHPVWERRLRDTHLRDLAVARRHRVTAALLRDVAPFTRVDRATWKRLRRLSRNGGLADGVAYRMDVRAGVALRMRALLVQIAGRTWLATHAAADDRARYEALVACENLTLGATVATGVADEVERPAFPAYEDDVRIARTVQPAWMGINFHEVDRERKEGLGIGEGAAEVLNVYPDSPAAAAGLRAGDVVLGPPDAPFSQKNQIRVWTMFSRVDEAHPLVVLRDGERLDLTLVPKPFPRTWPDLPGPVKVGDAAPPLDVRPYRGDLPAAVSTGTPHLLFFWATWCAPCKASVPEVLAFEAATGTRVIAVTDEPAKHLDGFFQKFAKPFPGTVVTDEARRAFIAYGVSGTPTFVLVNGAGTVTASWTGYSVKDGLHIPDWKWATAKSTSGP